jgi:hypothetical protein
MQSEGALVRTEQGTIGPFDPTDPLWSPLAEGVYGFFVPWIKILFIGICYECAQEDRYHAEGRVRLDLTITTTTIGCLTSIIYYHLTHMRTVFDDNDRHSIIDANSSQQNLYAALTRKGQVGTYDRPPLIVSFTITSL